jgi:hypothetical protein
LRNRYQSRIRGPSGAAANPKISIASSLSRTMSAAISPYGKGKWGETAMPPPAWQRSAHSAIRLATGSPIGLVGAPPVANGNSGPPGLSRLMCPSRGWRFSLPTHTPVSPAASSTGLARKSATLV